MTTSLTRSYSVMKCSVSVVDNTENLILKSSDDFLKIIFLAENELVPFCINLKSYRHYYVLFEGSIKVAS